MPTPLEEALAAQTRLGEEFIQLIATSKVQGNAVLKQKLTETKQRFDNDNAHAKARYDKSMRRASEYQDVGVRTRFEKRVERLYINDLENNKIRHASVLK